MNLHLLQQEALLLNVINDALLKGHLNEDQAQQAANNLAIDIAQALKTVKVSAQFDSDKVEASLEVDTEGYDF